MTDTVVIIPTYNNAGTLQDVLSRVLAQGLPVVVADDGCTDNTREVLDSVIAGPYRQSTVTVLTHSHNLGKGAALKTAFRWALENGYSYAVTIDSDGQHYPEDIPLLLEEKGERTLVVGSRTTRGANAGGSFANRFSNFWFTAYTGIRLTDTQTGFRLYPLRDLPSLKFVGSRYEAELSILLFSAWKGLRLVPVQVRVNYPRDRVTHFRPFQDFMRITLVNIIGLPLALLYGWPRILLRKLFT
ncbi:MAG: glycosyltransferase family 2 protein [Bacteroidales bacterium]|nr:glycosyltransferase family 2 protein [Bacteroidales bacterium]